MRILFLGNNRVGRQVLGWLKEQNEDVAGLVLHPVGKRRFGKEIETVADLNPGYIFDGSRLNEGDTFDRITALNPDIALSVCFDYILKPHFIDLFPEGVLNLHPSYLPFNRGQYPNVWSIIEETPAGVTLHYIDAGVDTGEIIAQQEVTVEVTDTGETLFRRLEEASVELFKKTWPGIRSGRVTVTPQSKVEGTYHRTSDVKAIDCIELEQTYKAKDLINVMRARTFPPYPGAYFEDNGRKIYMRLQLMYEDELF